MKEKFMNHISSIQKQNTKILLNRKLLGADALINNRQ